MTIPYVQSTDPINNQTDVGINSHISITFNTNLLESSVTSSNIFVVRIDDLTTYDMTPVDGTIQYDPSNYTILFLPSTSFSYNKVYQVMVKADANPADSLLTGIRSASGDVMIDDYVFRFTTVPQTTEDGDTSDSSSTDTEESIRSGYLKVLQTQPEKGKTFYNETYTKIKFNDDLIINDTGYTNFNEEITDSGTYLNSMVSVYRQPIMGSDSNHYMTPLEPIDYTWDLSDDILTLYVVDTGNWDMLPYNSKYTVTINPGMSGVSTYAMQSVYQYYFKSIIAPLYTTPHKVRYNAGVIFNTFSDEWIYNVIHKYSTQIYNITQEASENGGNVLSLPALPTDSGTVPEFIQRYVLCNVKLDLLRQVEMGQAVGAGDITLGDFSMDTKDISKMIKSERDALEDCVANTELYIQDYLYPGVKAMVPHLYDTRGPWYDKDGSPARYRHSFKEEDK